MRGRPWQLSGVHSSASSAEPNASVAADCRLDVACGWAAWTLPLLFGVHAMRSGPGWNEDLAALRDIGLQPAGSEGMLSSLFCQLALLVPVGARSFRAALVGVLALSVCSGLLFGAVRLVLQRERRGRLDAALALVASQLWASSAAAHAEAARLGGAMLGLALLCFGLRCFDELQRDARAPALAGGLTALTFAEHHLAGVALLGVWLVTPGAGGLRSARARETSAMEFCLGLFTALGVLAGFRALRAYSPRVLLDFGWRGPPRSSAPDSELGFVQHAAHVAQTWLEMLGAVPACLALAGIVWALSREPLRRALRPFWMLLALGCSVPVWRALGLMSTDFFVLAGSLGLAASFPLALRALLTWLWSSRVSLARPVAALACAALAALVLSRLDERPRASAESTLGKEIWTEAALGHLPPHALLLVRHPDLTLRLLAAQLLHGERPDVLLVPAGLWTGDGLLRQLREEHPEVAPLLRQLAVSGFADEYAMSQLADARRVMVELDANWNHRLLELLRPHGLWLELAPHAQGSLDRRAGTEHSLAALWRVYEPLHEQQSLDPPTSAALAELAGQQALALAAVGERKDAQRLLAARRRWASRDPIATQLGERLRQGKRGLVAVADLMN